MASTDNDTCMGQTKTFLRSQLSVYENWNRSSTEVENIRSLGSMPLYVLTAQNNASDHPKMAAAWHRMHERYARLSTRGVHRYVPRSDHVIQRDRPDILVQTVAEAIKASKS
jgi:hypothetical protein